MHGVAVGLMMPHVIRWNSNSVGSLYQDLVSTAGWADPTTSPETAAEQLASGFTKFLQIADMPVSISQAINEPANEKILDSLAAEAVQQWTGTFNPRKMESSAFVELYRNALS